MNKKIILIAEIVLALAFVVLMAGILTGVIKFGDDTKGTLDDINTQIQNSELEVYDGTTLLGDAVSAAIKRFNTTKSGVKLAYGVVHISAAKYRYGETASVVFPTGYTPGSAKNIDKLGDAEFISPAKEFSSELVLNANKVVVGIIFTEKN